MPTRTRSAAERRGRSQRKASSTARVRRPDLSRFYGRELPAYSPGEFDFRLDLLRGKDAPRVSLDPFVVAFEWTDEETAMSGSVTMRRPGDGWESLPVGRGHQVRLRVRWAGRWYTLWTLRVGKPSVAIDGSGIEVQVPLKDDLDIVKRGRRRYLYRKTKARPRGWYGHEILRDAARRDGIVLGAIAKCEHRMPKVDFRGSFLDLAVKVYEHERKKTARRYVVRMRDGKFEAVPYKRNPVLYVFAGEMRSAQVEQASAKERPVTVLTGTARVGKGTSAKRRRHTEARPRMVARFGYSQKTKDYGRVDSVAELREAVKRDLADEYRVKWAVTAQMQGVPFLRRGDGARCVIPSEGFVGDDSFVFATAVRHQVQGGTYTTDADFTRDDPFAKDRERREKELRTIRRRARKRGDR